MRKDKEKAIVLRKQGLSYREIQQRLNVSKGTLAVWFHGQPWSQEVKDSLTEKARQNARDRMRLISHRAREERRSLYREKRAQAEDLFQRYSKDPLFVAGLMLYWGEGDSNLQNGKIRITNADPLMLRHFHTFLQRYLPEVSSKAKMYLILYPDLDDKRSRQHWSRVVKLPMRHFMKSTFIQGRSTKRTLPYGIGTLLICSRAYKEVLDQWIKMYKQEHTRV